MSRSYIFSFDSLGCDRSAEASELIRYMKDEAKHKKEINRDEILDPVYLKVSVCFPGMIRHAIRAPTSSLMIGYRVVLSHEKKKK